MKKIALLGQKDWSLGSANFFLKKYLSPYYDISIFDWTSPIEIRRAISGEFDLIIGEASITRLEELNYKVHPSTQLLPIFHNGTLNLENSYFNINYDLTQLKKHYIGATTQTIKKEVEEKYGIKVTLLPLGVCDKFWEKRNITSISKLGHVSKPEHLAWDGYEDIKNYQMFSQISDLIQIPGDHVYGKHFSEGTKIYNSFDIVICTSTIEGQPFPFLECAAAKIPFISTKVGIIPEYNSVKTFETIEEAVEIIRNLNSSPLTLQQYIEDVYNEVMTDRNWEKIIKEYWVPTINNIL